MFSVRQKQEIAAKIEKILRDINHPEMPKDIITFTLHVDGAESWSWATIHENRDETPAVNPWNELQDPETSPR